MRVVFTDILHCRLQVWLWHCHPILPLVMHSVRSVTKSCRVETQEIGSANMGATHARYLEASRQSEVGRVGWIYCSFLLYNRSG